MRVLIIKMTSMGDVLHTLPAVTDALNNIGGIRFDWVVEEAFHEIPAWHRGVHHTIAVPLRRWRREPARWFGRELRCTLRELRREHYDHVIDVQGLYKSAVIACLCRGRRAGYASDSAREPLAARVYSDRTSTKDIAHAIDRTRLLFARTLEYDLPHTRPDYGLSREDFLLDCSLTQPYLVFNHASTWPAKSWPERYWRDLIEHAASRDLRVLLPWGSEQERTCAERLSRGQDLAVVLPQMTLGRLAGVLAHAVAVVSVDTGLGHLAAALGTPAVSLYGATDPSRTGTVGENQHHLRAAFRCSPCMSRRCTYTEPAEVTPACYATVSPDQVWGTLQHYIDRGQQ